MASSRPIAAGETYTPGDINNLRADVLDPNGGHRHDGTNGARVPFANLNVIGAAGAAPVGGSKSYSDLANHVATDQGAHGLNALAHVIGALTPSWLIQTGTITLSMTGNPNSIASGGVEFASTGVAFSGVPIVVLSHNSNAGDGAAQAGVSVVSANGFNWIASVGVGGSMSSINWIAIGPKT